MLISSPVYLYSLGNIVSSTAVVHVLAVLTLYSNMYFAIPDVASSVSVPLIPVVTVTVLPVFSLFARFTAGGGVVSFHTSAVLSFDLFPAPSTVLA